MVKAHRHGRAASWLLPSFCSSRARARQCADGDGYRPIVRERVPKSAGGSELGLQLWRGWPVATLPPRGGARAPAVAVRLESQRHRRKEDARRGRGLTAAIADTMAYMKQPAEPSSQQVPAGIVERVTFHNAENGFLCSADQGAGARRSGHGRRPRRHYLGNGPSHRVNGSMTGPTVSSSRRVSLPQRPVAQALR